MAIFKNDNDHPGPPPQKSVMPEHIDPTKCQHLKYRYVKRTLINGEKRYGMQCIGCGNAEITTWLGASKAAEIYQCSPDEYKEYDDEFTNNIRMQKTDFYLARREDRTEKWWDWYDLYLNSGSWKNLREKILLRDRYQCVACGGSANHVHHLTYARVGYEHEDDLVSICEQCHEAVHRGHIHVHR